MAEIFKGTNARLFIDGVEVEPLASISDPHVDINNVKPGFVKLGGRGSCKVPALFKEHPQVEWYCNNCNDEINEKVDFFDLDGDVYCSKSCLDECPLESVNYCNPEFIGLSKALKATTLEFNFMAESAKLMSLNAELEHATRLEF